MDAQRDRPIGGGDARTETLAALGEAGGQMRAPSAAGVAGLLGIVPLVAVTVLDRAILVLPAWVAIVSLFLMRRERPRGRAAAGTQPTAPPP